LPEEVIGPRGYCGENPVLLSPRMIRRKENSWPGARGRNKKPRWFKDPEKELLEESPRGRSLIEQDKNS